MSFGFHHSKPGDFPPPAYKPVRLITNENRAPLVTFQALGLRLAGRGR